MIMHPNRVICFEGIPGCGKSHLIHEINDSLKGVTVIPEFFQDPSFRERLVDSNGEYENLVDAMNEAQGKYNGKIGESSIVLMDRGIYTLMAFGRIYDHLPKLTVQPTRYIILNCFVGTAISRIQNREKQKPRDPLISHYLNPLSLERARVKYSELKDKFSDTYFVDAERSQDRVLKQVLEIMS